MKTLDEVIRAIEWCTELDQSGCGACPYSDTADNRCYEEDALRYLKVFRDAKDALDTERDRYAEAVKNCEVAENKYRKLCEETSQNYAVTSQNEPLTWDELKTMEGKPVWVEIGDGSKGWVIIRKIADSGIVSGSDGFIGFDKAYGMDTTWQAYRKERG